MAGQIPPTQPGHQINGMKVRWQSRNEGCILLNKVEAVRTITKPRIILMLDKHIRPEFINAKLKNQKHQYWLKWYMLLKRQI